MFEDLKQFVAEDVCLSCDGCCRFKEPDSLLRPRLTQEEMEQPAQGGLAEKIFSKEDVDFKNQIKTAACGGEHHCRFFSSSTNACAVYQNRPFECRLYPFVLVRSRDRIQLSAHHHCPFIQKKRHSKEFENYVGYLKEFFARRQTTDFVKRQALSIEAYEDYQSELEELFTVCSHAPNGTLLGKKPLFEEFVKESGVSLSGFSFVNLFLWKDFFDFTFEIIDGNLCVFAQDALGRFLYLPPLGEAISKKAVSESFRIMEAANRQSGVSRIENVSQGQLEAFLPSEFRSFKKGDEYIYRREDIAALKGNDFKSKRSDYNYFVRNYPCDFLPLTPEMSEECLALYDFWSEERKQTKRDSVYLQMLDDSRKAHGVALNEIESLGLTGRAVVVNGTIKAYSLGYRLNDRVFCILAEITDLSIKGLAMFIFRQFCADDEIKKFEFINVMDDFGLDNIKVTKLSFRPHQVVPSYVVTRKL